MKEEIVIAGAGGQGLLLTGSLIAQVAILENKHTTWLPSYGPAMRGGKANCAVIVSDEEIGSPLIELPTALIVMNELSLVFVKNVKAKGAVLLNSSQVKWNNSRTDLEVVEISADEIALSLGNIKVANVVMLGAYLKTRDFIDKQSVVAVLEGKFGKNKQVLELNKKALDLRM